MDQPTDSLVGRKPIRAGCFTTVRSLSRSCLAVAVGVDFFGESDQLGDDFRRGEGVVGVAAQALFHLAISALGVLHLVD